jgi:tetratricopeptide (TPR) repeat protein
VRRHGRQGLTAFLGAFTATVFAIVAGFAPSVVDQGWLVEHRALVVAGILVVGSLSVLFDVWRRSQVRSTTPSVDAGDASRAEPLVVGALPRRPRNLRQRDQVRLLQEALWRRSKPAEVHCLLGGRGFGKRQVAAEVARQAIDHGAWFVGWIPGGSREALLGGLAEVARALKVADPNGDALKSAVAAQTYLQSRSDEALIVVDGATLEADPLPLLPSYGGTRILITSTARAYARVCVPIEVPTFSPEEAVDYLCARARRPQVAGATQLAKELGYSPLGLAQAAALLDSRPQLSCEEFAKQLSERRLQDALPDTPGTDHDIGVTKATLQSLDYLETHDPEGMAMSALSIVAVLDSSSVELSLITRLQTTEADADQVASAASRLVDLSLAAWTDERGTAMTVHNLVAATARDLLAARDLLNSHLISVAERLHASLPSRENAWPSRRQAAPLVTHAHSLWTSAVARQRDESGPPQTADAAFKLVSAAGRHLRAIGDASRAAALAEAVLKDCVRIFGPRHVTTLQARSDLAIARTDAGKVLEALDLHQSVLDDRQRLLGIDHFDTLVAKSRLARAVDEAGDPHRAMSLHTEVWRSLAASRGDDHPRTIEERLNLASAQRTAGNSYQALEHMQEALARAEALYGREHRQCRIIRNNIAELFVYMGRYKEAVSLFEENLEHHQDEGLGEDHPETLTSRLNLAYAKLSTGKASDARKLGERVAADLDRVFGSEHPNTLSARHLLAAAFVATGDGERGLMMQLEVLEARTRRLGPQHPDVFATKNDIANTLVHVGDHAGAVEQLKEVVADCEADLAKNHPQTLLARASLAAAYGEVGNTVEAQQLLEQVLNDIEDALGKDSKQALDARLNLAYLHQRNGNVATSVDMLSRIAEESKQRLGVSQPQTLTAVSNLAVAHLAAGNHVAGMKLLRQVAQDSRRSLGPKHPVARQLRSNYRWFRIMPKGLLRRMLR